MLHHPCLRESFLYLRVSLRSLLDTRVLSKWTLMWGAHVLLLLIVEELDALGLDGLATQYRFGDRLTGGG